MKLLFSSLICHRDVEIFKFNWFCSRIHLDKGFDIPHLLLHDGSLTEEDKTSIRALPNVILEDEPIVLHNVPKAPLLGKLQTHKRGFDKYGADQVILFDCDIFFYKNWEADLRKMLQCQTVVMRDWGSSLGPNVVQYKELFGVHEDLSTPNCNTGIISIRKEDYHKVEEKISMHLSDPFMVMEDQGIMFASFYGELDYVEGIKCVINNAENITELWDWVLRQRGCHLMGMRTRHLGLDKIVEHCLKSLPKTINLKQLEPTEKHVSWGMLEYDTYNFQVPLQKVPTSHRGKYVTNALYMHGGSWAKWELPDRISRFTAKIICLDTGIQENVLPIDINGKIFCLNEEVDVPCDGRLEIVTQNGPGSHLAFINPSLHLDTTTLPILNSLKAAINQSP